VLIFSDANFSSVELDYFLVVKLGLVAAVVALAVASVVVVKQYMP
jgi:hypothetical protein